MLDDEGSARRRIGFLRSSTCTPAHVKRHRRALIRGWQELLDERTRLARDKAAWFQPLEQRGQEPGRDFCFVLSRMKQQWREEDRRHDLSGRPADLTSGATDARKNWFEVLGRVITDGEIVRIRHRYHDRPALILTEDHYRELERAARRSDPGGRPDGAGRPAP